MSREGGGVVVDVHAHAVPPEAVAALERHGESVGVEVAERSGERWFVHRQGYAYPVGAAFTSREAILGRMDEARVDHRVLSIPPTLFFYDAPADRAAQLAAVFNDALVAFVRSGGGRLSAMITVPLQAPERAAREVERLAGEPLVRAVEIGTDAGERALDDPRLEPFFAACEAARLPLFLHPYYVGPRPRLEPYYLTNSLGNPIETTVAVARLIHGGVLHRHPGLRVILAHGGGFYPYQRGRLAHAFRVRPEPRAVCQLPPEAFDGQIYCDSVLHSPAALRCLTELVGADRVLLGSDDPFDMGTPRPVEAVEQAGLPPDQRQAVLGGNAARLLDLTGAGARGGAAATAPQAERGSGT